MGTCVLCPTALTVVPTTKQYEGNNDDANVNQGQSAQPLFWSTHASQPTAFYGRCGATNAVSRPGRFFRSACFSHTLSAECVGRRPCAGGCTVEEKPRPRIIWPRNERVEVRAH